jgi:AbrB family looped-hinge helix DNA binding protein
LTNSKVFLTIKSKEELMMEKVLKLTRKRQLTIPKKMLEKLSLDAGDTIVLRVEEGRIIIEKGPKPLDEVWGILKDKAQTVGDIDDYVRSLRGER